MNSHKYIQSIACAALMATPCIAQSDSKDAQVAIAPAPVEDKWEYKIAPYLWLSGIEGQQGVNGIVADIDAPLSDILDVLDFAGYLAFEANKGNWGYYADLQYIKLSGEKDGPSGPLIDEIEMGMEQFRMELGIKYRIYHTERTTIHLMGGAQYSYLSTDLEISGQLSQDIDGSTDWIDPTVGLAINHEFNDKWNAHFVGQVGGFGAASDSTWQILAGIGYQLNDCWRLVGGYRHQYIDYEKGGFLYDLDIGGPVLGAVYKF